MIAKIGAPLALLSMMCHLVTFAVIIDMHARIGPGGTMGAMHGPHRHLESSVADAVEAAVEQKNAELTATLHALTKVVEDLQETVRNTTVQGSWPEPKAQYERNATRRQMQQGSAADCDASGVCTARIITRTVVMQSVTGTGGVPQRGRRRAQNARCDFAAQSAEVMAACCAATGGGHRRAQADCPLPTICPSAQCAEVFQTFYSSCRAELAASPQLGVGLAALSASCNELLAGSSMARQLNAQCTDGNLRADCVPECTQAYHGYLLLLNVDGEDTKLACELHHGLYSWFGAAVRTFVHAHQSEL